MKVLVTGVSGQLGHDVMNELAKRGYTGVGSDIAPEYSGVDDNTAVVIWNMSRWILQMKRQLMRL